MRAPEFVVRFLSRQSARPQGLFGRFWVVMMGRVHDQTFDWVLGLIDIQPGHRVLDLGFGSGVSLGRAARRAYRGRVVGVDVSDASIRVARRRNRPLLSSGRLELREGEAKRLPLDSGAFDCVYAINVCYLWPELDPVFAELRRVMRPGGMTAVHLAPLEQMEKMGFTRTPDIYFLHDVESCRAALERAGFERIECHETMLDTGTNWLLLAR